MLVRALPVAIFLITVVLWAPAALSQEIIVTLEDSTPAELCPACTSLRFLLKPSKQVIQVSEKPIVEFVSLGGERRNVQGFTAEWIADEAVRGLKVNVDAKELVRAGTYDVYINLQPKSSPNAPRMKVQIYHPPPKLAPIPKLIFDRTYWFIGMETTTQPELFLHEISKKSNATRLIFNKAANASLGALPIGGTLRFQANPLEAIEAGEYKKIGYSLENDFGLGISTGTIKIESAEVLEPLGMLDFEVRSRVHWIYIGLTILTGLVFSYFLKVRLQQRLELGQARLDAYKLLEHITREEHLHRDPAFQSSYRSQVDELQRSLTGNNPNDINSAKTSLDTIWRSSLQDLARRHQDEVNALDKIRDLTSLDYHLPPALNEAIIAARTSLASVMQLIDVDHLVQAEAQRGQVVTTLGVSLQQAANIWQEAQRQILGVLQNKPKGISESLSLALVDPAQNMTTALTKVNSANIVENPDQIKQLLNDVRLERLWVRQFVDWLNQAITAEFANARRLIDEAKVPGWDTVAFSSLFDKADGLINYLDSAVDSPNPSGLTAQLESLDRAWANALQKQFVSLSEAVKARLDARDYVEAVKVAINEKQPQTVTLGISRKNDLLRSPAFSAFQGGQFVTPISLMRTYFQTVSVQAPVQPTSVTAENQLRRDKRTQSIAVGFLLVIFGYALQINTFTGTFTDFSTLFFWAFGLDLTLDAIRGTVKRTA